MAAEGVGESTVGAAGLQAPNSSHGSLRAASPKPHMQTPPMMTDMEDHPVPTDNIYAEEQRTGWTPAGDEL